MCGLQMTVVRFAIGFLILMNAPQRAQAQDFKKVVDIVVEIEESLKKMIAEERSQRKAEIASLKNEVQELRSSVAAGVSAASLATTSSSVVDANTLVQRIGVLEKKVEDFHSLPEVSTLTDQLTALIAELKKAVEQAKTSSTSPSQAAPEYSITGQIRHRTETDGRSFQPGARPVWFNLLRSRVNVLVKPVQDVRVFVQVQDARLFGSGSSALARGTMDGTAKALDFHQAYFSVNKLFSSPINVKVGRQELVYGNERMVGGVGWSNIGRSFDGAVISYSTEDVVLDFFTSKLVGTQTSTASENFRGFYSTFRFFQPHLFDAFLLYDNNTSDVPRSVDAGLPKLSRYTIGTYVRGKPNPIDYEFEFAYQAGKTVVNDTSPRASITAYLISGSFGYTLDSEKKLRIGVLYTLLSGDDDPKDNTARTFNTLFATNHKFYGYMDYFPGILPNQGLNNIALTASIQALSNLHVALDLHHFELHQKATLADPSGSLVEQKTLGKEIDLTATVKYNANISFIAGCSAFVPENVVRALRGNSTSYWGYIMTLVNF